MELDLTKEEHILGPERPRKAVGLFAKDALGTGVFELSALSTASGTQFLTNAAGGSGGGTSTVFVANAVGNVTLNPSPNFIGIVTIANPAATAGMLTLFPGPNHIGSVTIFGTVQSTPGMTTLFPGPNFIGIVTTANQPALVAGTAQVGSVTVSNFTAPNVGNVTLNASSAYIGLASVNVGAIAAGNTYIGSVTVTIGNPTAVPLGDALINPTAPSFGAHLLAYNGTTWERVHNEYSTGDNLAVQSAMYVLPLNRVFNGSNWDRWRGSASAGGDVNIKRSVTTNFAGVLSASGYSTIFVPPSGQRFFIHTAMINAKGLADGYIGSTSNPLIPYVGLATYGGFVHPNDNSGIPATAVDQSLTIRQHSLVTISYQVSAHFE